MIDSENTAFEELAASYGEAWAPKPRADGAKPVAPLPKAVDPTVPDPASSKARSRAIAAKAAR